jgi:hypothetical protein
MMMSALPPKADMCGALAHVCFGPKADIDRESEMKFAEFHTAIWPPITDPQT